MNVEPTDMENQLYLWEFDELFGCFAFSCTYLKFNVLIGVHMWDPYLRIAFFCIQNKTSFMNHKKKNIHVLIIMKEYVNGRTVLLTIRKMWYLGIFEKEQ